MTAYNPEYFQNNKGRYSVYGARQRDKIKLEMVEAYGGECEHCGESDPVVLSLDHIFDDAEIEKELYGLNARGGHKHYHRLKKAGWPKDRFQLLCFNCNARKEHARRRTEMEERNTNEYHIVDRAKSKSKLGAPAHNKSGIKGVFWDGQKQKWHATIMVDYKANHIGFFDDLREAAHVYGAKAKELWGDEAKIATEEEIEYAIANLNKPIVATVLSADLGL